MKQLKTVCSFFVLMATGAWAQSAAPSAPQQNTPNSPEVSVPRKPQNTVYDFSDVDILGKLKSPEGKAIVEPPEFKFKRLLDLDESFVPNILRSVDDF